MIAPYSCPECGGKLNVDEHSETTTEWFRCGPGIVGYTEVVRRPAIVAGCVSCEFCIEVVR